MQLVGRGGSKRRWPPGAGARVVQAEGIDKLRRSIEGKRWTITGWVGMHCGRRRVIGPPPMRHQLACENVSAATGSVGLDEVAEPRGIGAVITDPADGGSCRCWCIRERGGCAGNPSTRSLGLLQPGVIIPGSTATRLIDHIGREVITHRIGCPALRSLRCRLDTCSGMRGT